MLVIYYFALIRTRELREVCMLDLYFQCPRSGSVIASGIRTDDASIQRVAQLPVSVFCPWCKQNHRMRVCDGQLIEIPDSGVTKVKRRRAGATKA